MNIIQKLLAERTGNIFIQLIRYGMVGGVAFLVDFGLLALLTEYLNVPYLISATLSFLGGLFTNYSLSISWVFNSTIPRDKTSRLAEFALFAIIGVTGLGINILILWASTDLLGVYYLISKIISTIIVFGWNFLGRRIMISKFNIICQTTDNKTVRL